MSQLGRNIRVLLGQRGPGFGRERARAPLGEASTAWWNVERGPFCSDTAPSQGPPISSEILPAQTNRWACARSGPMPRLDGIADRLRAVVSNGRFRRELGANMA